MQHIPPIVFSSLMLLDPVCTAILSWMIGIEPLPSIFSWLGGFLVLLGVGFITYGEKDRNHFEEAVSHKEYVSIDEYLDVIAENSSHPSFGEYQPIDAV